MDDRQLVWLESVLTEFQTDLKLVMIHHNVVEHLPDQSTHGMGQRYMLGNAPVLRSLLKAAGVHLVFTGHLHVQDVACDQGVYDNVAHGDRIFDFPHFPPDVRQFFERCSAIDEAGQPQLIDNNTTLILKK